MPYERTCDANQIFNPTELSCEPGDQYTCELYSETTSSATTDHPTIKPPTPQPCAGLHWDQNVAHPTICFKYYSCVSGIAFKRTCPDNQIFDPSSSNCELGDHDTCVLYPEISTETIPTVTDGFSIASTVSVEMTTVRITTTTEAVYNPCVGVISGNN